MSVCTAIEKVRSMGTSDLLRVTIDNTVTALWFYEYANALEFLNQEVIVEYRNDILDGQMQQFIKTFVRPRVVTTLDKDKSFKLFLDQEDNNSNLSFEEIFPGETKHGCIVFCTKQEYKTSKSAAWLELLIRDKMMRVAKLRLFSYDTRDAKFEGTYIRCDLERNQYGFQTRDIIEAGGEVYENQELPIAEKFVLNYFADDVVAMDFINKSNLFAFLAEHVDYEKGYAVMRLAMELAFCDALHNITKDVDVTAIGQALLLSYAHYTRKSLLSPAVNNVFIANQYMFANRRTVVLCLDELNENRPEEAKLFDHIKQLTSTVIEMRKGVN